MKYAGVAVAALLIGVLAGRFTAPTKVDPPGGSMAKSSGENTDAAIQEFTLEGMSCQGCVDTVTAALKAVPGVRAVRVSLTDKRAVVAGDPSQVTAKQVEAAVAAAGYKAVADAATR